jgi:hypothetical protein
MVKDGFRPALDIIFLDWNSHSQYKKFVGTNITPPPEKTLQQMQAEVKLSSGITN